MTAKEWLSRGREANSRIKELEREKQRLYETAVRTVGYSTPDRVQTSPGNTQERNMVLYSSASQKIDEETTELLKVIDEIAELIAKVENITYRRLLSMRYIEFMTWEDIAYEMYYNVRHIYKVHEKALIEADKILMKERFYQEKER